MASRVGMRWIAPARDPFLVGPYLDEVEEALSELGEDIKADFQDVVSDWTTPVEFRKVLKVEAGGVEVKIHPARNAKIWHWVDKGTSSHTIRAKTPKGLRYRKGYSARTKPGGVAHAGSGQATGDWRRAQEVTHPGSAPRDFTKTIYERWQPELKSTVMGAIRDAK